MFAVFVCPITWALATCPIHAAIALDVRLALSLLNAIVERILGKRDLEPHCSSMCATAASKELDKVTPTYGGREITT